eukprot:scaffold124721_cov66-Phaeocystis_antarctica.AAC.3
MECVGALQRRESVRVRRGARVAARPGGKGGAPYRELRQLLVELVRSLRGRAVPPQVLEQVLQQLACRRGLRPLLVARPHRPPQHARAHVHPRQG